MALFCENKSPRKLCEEAEKFIASSPEQRMTRRPFNHYVPTLTDWWIVPSTELPFFKFGKYCFAWDENKRDEIRCGYFVTKGIDSLLKSVFSSKKGKRLLMDSSWGWYGFLDAVKSGKFEEMLRKSAMALGENIELIFHGGYIDDPGVFDPQTALGRRDRYTFLFSPGENSLRLKSAQRPAMAMKFLNKVRDWQTFLQAVETLAGDQFMWCDFFAAAVFQVREYGDFAPEEKVLNAQDICGSYLNFFAGLVR